MVIDESRVIVLEIWQAEMPNPDPRLRYLIGEFSCWPDDPDANGSIRLIVHWPDGTELRHEWGCVYSYELRWAIGRALDASRLAAQTVDRRAFQ